MTSTSTLGSVLVVEDEDELRRLVSVQLRRAGYEVTTAADGQEALTRIAEAIPDLVVSDVMMPVLDGFALLAKLRVDPATRGIPVILLTARGALEDRVKGFGLGADDYLTKPFEMAELLARVKSKIDRPPVPSQDQIRGGRTSLLSERAFVDAVGREFVRARRSRRGGCLAFLACDEVQTVHERLGTRAETEVVRELATLLSTGGSPLDVFGRDANGRFLILLPEVDLPAARRRLEAIATGIAGHEFPAAGEHVRLSPRIGYAAFADAPEIALLRDRALAALDVAAARTDLRPVRYEPAMASLAAHHRTREQRQTVFNPDRLPQTGLPTLDRVIAALFLILVSPYLLTAKGRRSRKRPTPSAAPRDLGPFGPGPKPSLGTVLVVEDEDQLRRLVSAQLRRAGYEVTVAADGHEALARIAEFAPDLVISDVMMPVLDGFGLLEKIRADPVMRGIPVMMLTAKGAPEDRVTGLGLGADDYLAKPFEMAELLARVRAKIERRPVPSDQLVRDRRTNLLGERAFLVETEQEMERARRSGRSGFVVCIALDEVAVLRGRFGERLEAEIARQVAGLLGTGAAGLEIAGRNEAGRFLLLMPEIDAPAVQRRLDELVQRIVGHVFVAAGERLRLTPVVGYAPFTAASKADLLLDRARIALDVAASHLDLRPVRFEPRMEAPAIRKRTAGAAAARKRRWSLNRFRTPGQIAATFILGLIVPYQFYITAYQVGIDVAPVMYYVVVIALVITAFFIWVEGFRAIAPPDIPAEPGAPYPPATAIIAAYMPNEAATVVDTIEAFLRIEYPGPLQIILAYNTPRPMPIEGVLREIAERDSRFLPLKIEHSTSKAQNVNAALSEARGEFIGVFDADHHPATDSFERAWRWLSNGYDVVQGHCLIRNGAESWVARTIAVEFESIYSVSHPGRARLHRFGIFGGSNGYWRADLLRRIRMRGFMLTEDIDSSLRVIEAGGKIASDPGLISRELAPIAFTALWNQRMRWAQGWFQVSMKHLWQGVRSSQLTRRQKFGLVYLLGWREIYPWISIQMFPIVGYWVWRYGSLRKLDWLIPIFVLTTIFTLSVGPGQVFFAYLVGAPEIRRRKRWFFWYLLLTTLFYTEVKNTIARVAQVKEVMKERQWKVTPRAATTEPGGTG